MKNLQKTSLKVGQLVNVFDDGKLGRASKAEVVRIYPDSLVLKRFDVGWLEEAQGEFEEESFEFSYDNKYENSLCNSWFLLESIEDRWSTSVRKWFAEPYAEYLLDTSTKLPFTDWYNDLGETYE